MRALFNTTMGAIFGTLFVVLSTYITTLFSSGDAIGFNFAQAIAVAFALVFGSIVATANMVLYAALSYFGLKGPMTLIGNALIMVESWYVVDAFQRHQPVLLNSAKLFAVAGLAIGVGCYVGVRLSDYLYDKYK